jgi:hypothetical protein
MKEKFEPSKEDYKKAEESMDRKQEIMSERREKLLNKMSPEQKDILPEVHLFKREAGNNNYSIIGTLGNIKVQARNNDGGYNRLNYITINVNGQEIFNERKDPDGTKIYYKYLEELLELTNGKVFNSFGPSSSTVDGKSVDGNFAEMKADEQVFMEVLNTKEESNKKNRENKVLNEKTKFVNFLKKLNL